MTDATVPKNPWEFDFAFQEDDLDIVHDDPNSLAMIATDCYICLRPSLNTDQRIVLDEIVSGLIWQGSNQTPLSVSIQPFQQEATNHLLAIFDEVNFDALRVIASEQLDRSTLDLFQTPDAFVNYLCQYRDRLSQRDRCPADDYIGAGI